MEVYCINLLKNFDSGLDRVTVSLDGIDDKIVQDISNSKFHQRNCPGIESAINAGLTVKINTVVIKTLMKIK